MSTSNPIAQPMTRRQRRIAEGRRLFRVLTEEERAARFDRILRLLDFLFKIIPSLSGTKIAEAALLSDELTDELYAGITHSIAEEPVEV